MDSIPRSILIQSTKTVNTWLEVTLEIASTIIVVQ
jgi:hypothetical protein